MKAFLLPILFTTVVASSLQQNALSQLLDVTFNGQKLPAPVAFPSKFGFSRSFANFFEVNVHSISVSRLAFGEIVFKCDFDEKLTTATCGAMAGLSDLRGKASISILGGQNDLHLEVTIPKQISREFKFNILEDQNATLSASFVNEASNCETGMKVSARLEHGDASWVQRNLFLDKYKTTIEDELKKLESVAGLCRAMDVSIKSLTNTFFQNMVPIFSEWLNKKDSAVAIQMPNFHVDRVSINKVEDPLRMKFFGIALRNAVLKRPDGETPALVLDAEMGLSGIVKFSGLIVNDTAVTEERTGFVAECVSVNVHVSIAFQPDSEGRVFANPNANTYKVLPGKDKKFGIKSLELTPAENAPESLVDHLRDLENLKNEKNPLRAMLQMYFEKRVLNKLVPLMNDHLTKFADFVQKDGKLEL